MACVLGFTVSIYETMLLKGSTAIDIDRDWLLPVQPNLRYCLVFGVITYQALNCAKEKNAISVYSVGDDRIVWLWR